MSFSTLDPFFDIIMEMKKQGKSYQYISVFVRSNGVHKGSSVANIKRFCADRKLTRATVSQTHLELAVAKGIQETGDSFGRKMMTGYLSSKGIHASEGRVGQVLRSVQPQSHAARSQGARNLNPVPYNAEYMGHKIHLDQNEKLVMFGTTHVLAIDGFTSKIVSHSTMPIKNNILIYENVFRPAVISFSIWDQVRVDHGKEFLLTLFMQQQISAFRNNTDRLSYVQTNSTRNHRIERIWPEINNRVNYPIKAALVNLMDQEEINMEDDTVRFCVSNLTCQISSLGISRVVEAWNAHRIPGKGVPNTLAQSGCVKKITVDLLPHASEAADLYESETGSSLTRCSSFGKSPFSSEEDQAHAEGQFAQLYPDMNVLYENVVNHNPRPFQDAILHLIHLSRH
ncbi:uncharacterized protein [Paramormyrops kingsleyae]|uniref:uncharacterized protein n=1 Tax=Paramormyrops kingsleyae TaxID=1676925 RepID=UPI003B972372